MTGRSVVFAMIDDAVLRTHEASESGCYNVCHNIAIQQLTQVCLKLAARIEELEEWRGTVAYDVERID